MSGRNNPEYLAAAESSPFLVTVTLKETDETVACTVPALMLNPEPRKPLSQNQRRRLARLLLLFARSLRA